MIQTGFVCLQAERHALKQDVMRAQTQLIQAQSSSRAAELAAHTSEEEKAALAQALALARYALKYCWLFCGVSFCHQALGHFACSAASLPCRHGMLSLWELLEVAKERVHSFILKTGMICGSILLSGLASCHASMHASQPACWSILTSVHNCKKSTHNCVVKACMTMQGGCHGC